VQTVAYAFPKVKIVTTACDTELDQYTGFICPGLGNFGDRYFGTDLIGYTSDIDDLITTMHGNNHFQPCLSDPSLSDQKDLLNNSA
ncbi:unnamed protein product, partial [Rotaria sp. Silwood1]